MAKFMVSLRLIGIVLSAVICMSVPFMAPAGASAVTYVDVPGTEAPSWMGGQPLPPTDPPGHILIRYPRSLWPLTGNETLDQSVATGVVLLDQVVKDNHGTMVITGTSQGAIIASIVKQQFDSNPSTAPSPNDVSFVLIGNPVRPNGGILSRFTELGGIPGFITFYSPTPNDAYKTTDFAHQYDGVSDFPTYPANVLADLNAILGAGLYHGDYSDYNAYVANPNDPRFMTRVVGNTTYVTEKEPLPLVAPLRMLGLNQLADVLEGPLQTIVELGYDRKDSPGTPVTAGILPPLKTLVPQLPPVPLPNLSKTSITEKPLQILPPKNLKVTAVKDVLASVTTPLKAPTKLESGSIVKTIPSRSHNAANDTAGPSKPKVDVGSVAGPVHAPLHPATASKDKASHTK